MSIEAKRPNELIEILKADFISRAESIKIHDHSSATEGGHDLHALAEVELNDPTELTIAAGVVTRTQVYHRIDTELDAGSDNLDTVNGGVTGDLLVIRAENSARTVVVKHNTGNIWLIGLADISLTDAEDHLFLIYDGAKWCSVGDGGGGGGAHDLLSATHGDTAAGAVVDGDVIVGNVTPAWSRLAISIPAANVRNVLGIDNGELRPAWKTALDAVAPTTMAAGDAAAAGTSLVFSHRDHRHGSPATWPPGDHDHSAPGSGGQLDWDNVWADAVHDHSSDAEGGALIDLNGAADALVLDADGDTSISAPTANQIDFEVKNADQIHISDGLLWPDVDDDIDLGDVSHQFKDGYIDGVLYADNVNLEGNADALVLDADGDTTIAADTDDRIDFEVGNADQVHISDGLIWPTTDNDVDLGDPTHEFKDGYFDGIVNADAVDLDGNADALVLDADGDTSISAPTDDQVDCEIGGSDLAFLTAGGWSTNAFAFIALNMSGAAAVAGDVGYIDSAGEYKTTTTAYLADAWCVVVKGGNDNTDIYVARRGRVTVTLNGNCSAGNYLYTSTTAGQAQPQTYVRPEILGVALTANAGGAGGTCSALLLTERTLSPATSSEFIYAVDAAASSDFVSTIASLPGGAPTTLTYAAVTAGSATTLVPWLALGTIAGKTVLHNTTRGTSALIQSVVTGTSTITLTANVPAGWIVGDTITARSQTCTGTLVVGVYYYDYDISLLTGKPILAVGMMLNSYISDTGAAACICAMHPYEAWAAAKTTQFWTQVAAQRQHNNPILGINNNRSCRAWTASGAATATLAGKLIAWMLATP